MKAKEQASVLFVMCMKITCIPLIKVWYKINEKNSAPSFSPFITAETM